MGVPEGLGVALGVVAGVHGTPPGPVTGGVLGVPGAAGGQGAVAAAVVPAVQSTLELPGVATEEPMKAEDSATGLLLVLAAPSQTRTTTRFMPPMLVSK